ncbi:hypothetical protein JCGZ_00112 [Jatropha curcas]|uniref:Uncharacterized protein n=1 Tax=Jatropha curcas TaxID=180498 RepID=A0A067JWA4_JATCU|nr:hypothetical protein JCGZ_00112 [Jatropha curcas]
MAPILSNVAWIRRTQRGRLAEGLEAIYQTGHTQLKLVIYLRSLHDFEHFGVWVAQFWLFGFLWSPCMAAGGGAPPTSRRHSGKVPRGKNISSSCGSWNRSLIFEWSTWVCEDDIGNDENVEFDCQPVPVQPMETGRDNYGMVLTLIFEFLRVGSAKECHTFSKSDSNSLKLKDEEDKEEKKKKKSREAMLNRMEKDLIEEHNRELDEAIKRGKAVVAHTQSLIESMEKFMEENLLCILLLKDWRIQLRPHLLRISKVLKGSELIQNPTNLF